MKTDVFELRISQLFGAKVPAVHDRHHQVEQDDARPQAAAELIERSAPVCGQRDGVALRLEQFIEGCPHAQVVVDNEDSIGGARQVLFRLPSPAPMLYNWYLDP